MQIKPDEITSILKSRIEGLDTSSADLTEVGTVLSVADGIARIHGLENCMSFEMLDLPHGVTALALNLESDNVGAVLFGEWEKIVEGDTVRRTKRLLDIPVGEELLGRIVDPLGNPLDGKGEIDTTETRPAEHKAPGVVQRQPVKEPMLTGLKAIDSMIPIGRGQRELIIGDRQTGQDGDRDRHDHQQQGSRPDLRLRRDRPAQVDRRAAREHARGRRRAGQHDHRHGGRRRGGADQVPGAVRGLRDGRVLPLQRQGRAGGLRRPHQARLRLPPDVAAAAPAAGPRGLPGRRLLPALAAARARRQAVRRARRSAHRRQAAGRRLADRAAGDRDAGRRRLGVHPDERDLDHRRPDLPRAEAVLLGRAPGDQRRDLGLARGRQRPDHADAQGRRPSEARALPVPRARGVLAVRVRARPRDPAHAGPRRAAGEDAQPVRAPPDRRSRTRSSRSTRPPTATWTASWSTRWSASWPTSPTRCAATSPSCCRRSPRATGATRPRDRSRRPSSGSPTTSASTSTRKGHPLDEGGDDDDGGRRRDEASSSDQDEEDQEESESEKEEAGAPA